MSYKELYHKKRPSTGFLDIAPTSGSDSFHDRYHSEECELFDLSRTTEEGNARNCSTPSEANHDAGGRCSDDAPTLRKKKPRPGSFLLYTSDEEQAVIRTLDRRLVSFVSFLYMLSFLDRSS